MPSTHSKIRWVPAVITKRPVTHDRRCRCTLCAPSLDFDRQREKDKPEIDQLRAEVERLRLENHELKVNRRAEKRAEKEAATAALAAEVRAADEKLERDRLAKLRASTDPRVKRLLKLRAQGRKLADALNQIDREDETP